MILTHPEFPRTRIGRDDQAELAKLGVVIEKNWFNLAQKSVMPEEMAETIRTVGSGHVYLATDGTWSRRYRKKWYADKFI